MYREDLYYSPAFTDQKTPGSRQVHFMFAGIPAEGSRPASFYQICSTCYLISVLTAALISVPAIALKVASSSSGV